MSLFNADTDLLFPIRTIPALRNARGEAWQKLVDRMVAIRPDSLEMVAFILMIARLSNCATCNADSFRAMNGCTACSRQSIKRFHGSDKDLVALYNQTRAEVTEYQTGDPSASKEA